MVTFFALKQFETSVPLFMLFYLRENSPVSSTISFKLVSVQSLSQSCLPYHEVAIQSAYTLIVPGIS